MPKQGITGSDIQFPMYAGHFGPLIAHKVYIAHMQPFLTRGQTKKTQEHTGENPLHTIHPIGIGSREPGPKIAHFIIMEAAKASETPLRQRKGFKKISGGQIT
jgi:hypothetical protein